MSIQELFQTISERIQTGASVKTVYGDPIAAEGKTIIPVARVRYGFGGGGGRSEGSEDGERPQGKGAGGGGGVEVTPTGFIEVTTGEARYVSFEERRRIVRAIVFGVLIALFLLRRRRRG